MLPVRLYSVRRVAGVEVHLAELDYDAVGEYLGLCPALRARLYERLRRRQTPCRGCHGLRDWLCEEVDQGEIAVFVMLERYFGLASEFGKDGSFVLVADIERLRRDGARRCPCSAVLAGRVGR